MLHDALPIFGNTHEAPTENKMKKCKQFLDYAASQEEAILTYNKRDMVLAIHSNVSYLSKSKSRSRAGGHWFMSGNEEIPANNVAVMNVSQIIKAVMSSSDSSTIPPSSERTNPIHTLHLNMGGKVQYAKGADDSPILAKADKNSCNR